VGERYIDTVEVRSSILLPPTISEKAASNPMRPFPISGVNRVLSCAGIGKLHRRVDGVSRLQPVRRRLRRPASTRSCRRRPCMQFHRLCRRRSCSEVSKERFRSLCRWMRTAARRAIALNDHRTRFSTRYRSRQHVTRPSKPRFATACRSLPTMSSWWSSLACAPRSSGAHREAQSNAEVSTSQLLTNHMASGCCFAIALTTSTIPSYSSSTIDAASWS
jgi:hypothetical protein